MDTLIEMYILISQTFSKSETSFQFQLWPDYTRFSNLMHLYYTLHFFCYSPRSFQLVFFFCSRIASIRIVFCWFFVLDRLHSRNEHVSCDMCWWLRWWVIYMYRVKVVHVTKNGRARLPFINHRIRVYTLKLHWIRW